MKNKKHNIVFQPSGVRGLVNEGTTILDAARELGAGLESICGGKGTCGKCKIVIETGHFAKYKMISSVAAVTTNDELNARHLTKQQLKQHYMLACQTKIRGDVVVFVPEESRKGQQVVRKEATERKITLKPAVEKYCIEIKPATLEDPDGDYERVLEILGEKFKLNSLTSDYPVLKKLQDAVRKDGWKLTVSVWKKKEIIDVQSGEVKNNYGLAVDIGGLSLRPYHR